MKEWRAFLNEEKARKFTSRVIIINAEDKILLLQNKEENERYPNQWIFPGGGSEPGENAKECAIREVFEETGLKTLEDDLWPVETFLKNGKNTYIFMCVNFEGTVNMKNVIHEHQNYQWVDPSELDNFHITKGAEALVRRAFNVNNSNGTQELL